MGYDFRLRKFRSLQSKQYPFRCLYLTCQGPGFSPKVPWLRRNRPALIGNCLWRLSIQTSKSCAWASAFSAIPLQVMKTSSRASRGHTWFPTACYCLQLFIMLLKNKNGLAIAIHPFYPHSYNFLHPSQMPSSALTHISPAHHPNPPPAQGVQLKPVPATACSPPTTGDGVWPHNSASTASLISATYFAQ